MSGLHPVDEANYVGKPNSHSTKKERKKSGMRRSPKLNAATTTDAFPLPFTDGILDAITGHEMYSFFDGFSGYNKI